MLREGGFEWSGHEAGSMPSQVESGMGARDPNASGALPVAALTGLLDEMGLGVVVVDRARRLRHVNHAGRNALESGLAVREVEGVLCAANPGQSGALQAAIDAACAGQRRFVLLGTERSNGAAVVLPFGEPNERLEPFAAVLLKRERIAADLGLYFFAQAYGLTDAEERVLDQVAQGASARAIAQSFDCAECTVRTHIRHLLEKTSTAGLRELTVLLGTMPPVASRLGGSAAPLVTGTAAKAGKAQP